MLIEGECLDASECYLVFHLGRPLYHLDRLWILKFWTERFFTLPDQCVETVFV